MAHTPLYDDGTYVVTDTILSTPRRIYPVANATAHIRSDPMWIACASAALFAATLVLYADLLTVPELLVGAAVVGGLFVIAGQAQILCVDAIGFPRAFIVTHPKKVRAIFDAIRRSRSADFRGSAAISNEVPAAHQYFDN